MNENELRERMADYLGGELSTDEHRRFEEALEKQPGLAAEVRGLEGALEAVRSLRDDARVPSGRGGPFRLAPILRYAAVVTLAFGTGFVVRGPAAVDVAVEEVQTEPWEERMAKTYLADDRPSSTAQGLAALSTLWN